MSNIEKIIEDIRALLKTKAPQLTEEQRDRMFKIINPDISNYIIYGIKTSEIERIVKTVFSTSNCNYRDAVEIFKILIGTNIEDEKFAAFFFLNRFKKYFNEDTINLFEKEYSKYCYTWSVCDSTCVRVIGPFLGRKENKELAKKTIDKWSKSENNWIKRASMVILLKIIMLHKDFDDIYIFEIVEEMLESVEYNYIEKGIGWLLKTCTKYKPDKIYEYLMKNKERFSRLILRYASEKLPKEKRAEILKK
jgi:3-methyladenine DNA glycosylase AlkD